jgi:hypothetical protein
MRGARSTRKSTRSESASSAEGPSLQTRREGAAGADKPGKANRYPVPARKCVGKPVEDARRAGVRRLGPHPVDDLAALRIEDRRLRARTADVVASVIGPVGRSPHHIRHQTTIPVRIGWSAGPRSQWSTPRHPQVPRHPRDISGSGISDDSRFRHPPVAGGEVAEGPTSPIR